MSSFAASHVVVAVVLVAVLVTWGGVGTDARPQPQSITDTLATPFATVADATEGALGSATSFFADTGDAINRFTANVVSSGRDIFNDMMRVITG